MNSFCFPPLVFFFLKFSGVLEQLKKNFSRSSSERERTQSERMSKKGAGPWCLHIALELKKEFVDKFLLKFAELARHVEANEPETLSYEIGRSDENECKFIIVERYSKKEYLAEPHQTSEMFKKFKQWMSANEEMFVSKDGFSFYEQQIGYMHR